MFKFPNIDKLLELVPCASWDPQTNTDPPGCDWFTTPPEPQLDGRAEARYFPAPRVNGFQSVAAACFVRWLRVGYDRRWIRGVS